MLLGVKSFHIIILGATKMICIIQERWTIVSFKSSYTTNSCIVIVIKTTLPWLYTYCHRKLLKYSFFGFTHKDDDK